MKLIVVSQQVASQPENRDSGVCCWRLQMEVQVRTSCPTEQKGETHILRVNINGNLVLQSMSVCGNTMPVASTHLSSGLWHIINFYDLKFQEGLWSTLTSSTHRRANHRCCVNRRTNPYTSLNFKATQLLVQLQEWPWCFVLFFPLHTVCWLGNDGHVTRWLTPLSITGWIRFFSSFIIFWSYSGMTLGI